MEEAKKVANENFDWNAFENDLGVYDQPKEQIGEAYDKTLSNIAANEVTEGTVIGINKREVVVNIGYKSEGIIPISEFRYNPDLKVGDKIEVYVESAEDKNGQLALSHKKARQLKSWDRVNEALEKDEIIKGYIKCRTKGGMIVDVFGIEAFLPGSQIDVKPIRDYDVYVDKTMEFKVVKINQEFRNVVVSHKALIEAELEAQKQVIMSKLEKGQILEGTVKNITSYGVFVDLGGVDGLIHITDLSWGRVNHPEEIVSLDEKIRVVILDFDDAKKRIALGLKQLDEFSNLVFDTTISNINVKTGDSYMVSYKCNKRLVPKIKSSGDTLTISQSNRANYKRNTTSEITVTIPEGAALNKLSLDTGVGEVNLNSLTAADAEFDTGVGDLYVTDCSFATCDVDGGTGNLSFENCAFDEMDIDGGTGNITVTSSQSLDGYMMDLDSGTGDITINGNDYDDEYEVNEHAKKHLVIDSGLGDIEVKY